MKTLLTLLSEGWVIDGFRDDGWLLRHPAYDYGWKIVPLPEGWVTST